MTVYIAGFPEYFDVDTSIGFYICLRWEKSTGNIDLAVNGDWVVGKNTCKILWNVDALRHVFLYNLPLKGFTRLMIYLFNYYLYYLFQNNHNIPSDASSRRINLPKSGRLVVGAEINTVAKPMLVDADSGICKNSTKLFTYT